MSVYFYTMYGFFRILKKAASELICRLYVNTLADSGYFQIFTIKVVGGLQFLGYFRTLSLKFQKAASKIDVFLCLPSWLSQFS